MTNRSFKKHIAAVVVTFNRADLLKECLLSLLQQSTALSQIIVVDNFSQDHTSKTVESLQENHPQKITYMRLTENTGGAGGFHTGVKAAYELGYEWIWLMDDDVEAYPDALEGLLKYQNKSKCIHGQRTSTSGQAYFWEGRLLPQCGFVIPYADRSFKEGKDSCKVNFGCFEGMLIHRDIVEKIGFPDERFFIAWDDTVYGYLASKHTDVLYVKHPVLIRKRNLQSLNIGFRTLPASSDMYRFYHIRNRGLVKQYLKNSTSFNSFLYEIVTILMGLKEYVRAIIIQRDFRSIKSILRGYIASFKVN